MQNRILSGPLHSVFEGRTRTSTKVRDFYMTPGGMTQSQLAFLRERNLSFFCNNSSKTGTGAGTLTTTDRWRPGGRVSWQWSLWHSRVFSSYEPVPTVPYKSCASHTAINYVSSSRAPTDAHLFVNVS